MFTPWVWHFFSRKCTRTRAHLVSCKRGINYHIGAKKTPLSYSGGFLIYRVGFSFQPKKKTTVVIPNYILCILFFLRAWGPQVEAS